MMNITASAIILLQSDAFWNNLPLVLAAFGGLLISCVTALISLLTFLKAQKNEKTQDEISHKTDGLLKELMELARDKYLEQGARVERAKRDKQDADENVGELRHLKKQQQHPSPESHKDSTDKIIDAVEDKGDEIQEGVKEIPKKVVDQIKKQPPKK